MSWIDTSITWINENKLTENHCQVYWRKALQLQIQLEPCPTIWYTHTHSHSASAICKAAYWRTWQGIRHHQLLDLRILTIMTLRAQEWVRSKVWWKCSMKSFKLICTKYKSKASKDNSRNLLCRSSSQVKKYKIKKTETSKSKSKS